MMYDIYIERKFWNGYDSSLVLFREDLFLPEGPLSLRGTLNDGAWGVWKKALRGPQTGFPRRS